MIVCSCNVLSDRDVLGCINPGPDCPRTPAQVYRCLGCSPQCGRCARTIRSIMQQAGATPAACAGCPAACESHHADAGEPAGV
ncbi:MAG: (2Fe-2S)-binding protein [Salinarimonas sp.]